MIHPQPYVTFRPWHSPLGQAKAWKGKASLPEIKQNKPSISSSTSFLGNTACWRCNCFLSLLDIFRLRFLTDKIYSNGEKQRKQLRQKVMSIFKELRRRSKASFRTTTSTDSQSNDNAVSGQSSSTIDSSTTPPSSIKPSLSSPNLSTLNEAVNGSTVPPVPSPLPQRPVPITSQSNRHSYYVYAPRSLFL